MAIDNTAAFATLTDDILNKVTGAPPDPDDDTKIAAGAQDFADALAAAIDTYVMAIADLLQAELETKIEEAVAAASQPEAGA